MSVLEGKSHEFLPRKRNLEFRNEPEWRDDLCDKRGRENRERRSYNPNNTYYIHSYGNRHETCIEQRSFHGAKVSAMAAIGYLPPQELQRPVLTESAIEIQRNPD